MAGTTEIRIILLGILNKNGLAPYPLLNKSAIKIMIIDKIVVLSLVAIIAIPKKINIFRKLLNLSLLDN